MDDNARPHRWRALTANLQSEAMNFFPLPVMNPDLNSMKHASDTLGCTGSWTSCTKLTSGIATATTAVHPTTNWKDNTDGWGLHPSTWRVHPILNVEPLSLSDSQLVFSKWNDNCIVHFELLNWLIKMDIFNVKTGIVIVWQFIH